MRIFQKPRCQESGASTVDNSKETSGSAPAPLPSAKDRFQRTTSFQTKPQQQRPMRPISAAVAAASLGASLTLGCTPVDIIGPTADEAYWQENTVEMYIHPSVRENYGERGVRAVEDAAKSWENIHPDAPKLTILREHPPGDAKVGDRMNSIAVDFRVTDETSTLATATSIQRESGKRIESDININSEQDFCLPEYASASKVEPLGPCEKFRTDFQSVMTHELGHVLGFPDDYEPQNNSATMYGYLSPEETHKRVPSILDQAYSLLSYGAGISDEGVFERATLREDPTDPGAQSNAEDPSALRIDCNDVVRE